MHDILAWIEQTFGSDPDYKQVLLTLMTPIVLLAVGIEWWSNADPQATHDYYWKDTLVNVALAPAKNCRPATWAPVHRGDHALGVRIPAIRYSR